MKMNGLQKIDQAELRAAHRLEDLGFDFYDIGHGWTGGYPQQGWDSDIAIQWRFQQYATLRATVCSWKGHQFAPVFADIPSFQECSACGVCNDSDCCDI